MTFYTVIIDDFCEHCGAAGRGRKGVALGLRFPLNLNAQTRKTRFPVVCDHCMSEGAKHLKSVVMPQKETSWMPK